MIVEQKIRPGTKNASALAVRRRNSKSRNIHTPTDGKKCYREVTMKTLLREAVTPQSGAYGPDPVLLKKQGLAGTLNRDISEYKRKIRDDSYIDHAINRIAMELSHFLAR